MPLPTYDMVQQTHRGEGYKILDNLGHIQALGSMTLSHVFERNVRDQENN